MVIKKVTVKFDSCIECPIHRYVGCPVTAMCTESGEIPGDCPIETSAMLNRYTEFSTSRGGCKDDPPAYKIQGLMNDE